MVIKCLVSSCIGRLLHVYYSSKGIFHPRTGHEDPEGEQSYSTTLSLTSALGGGLGGQRHAPAALPPGNTPYPLYRRLGGLQGRSRRVRKIRPPPGFDPRTVQLVESCYTDWDIPAHLLLQYFCTVSPHELNACVLLLWHTFEVLTFTLQ